jgi:exodeoxyribonuclease VII large subunit
MPIIAAVGHEIDMTLIDYVADKRASTPTGAAELATVDKREIEKEFSYASLTMEQAITNLVSDKKEEIETLKEDLLEALQSKVEDKKTELNHLKVQLELLNPKNVLSRGYSLSLDEKGKPITSVNQIKENQVINTLLSDGELTSRVIEIKESK